MLSRPQVCPQERVEVATSASPRHFVHLSQIITTMRSSSLKKRSFLFSFCSHKSHSARHALWQLTCQCCRRFPWRIISLDSKGVESANKVLSDLPQCKLLTITHAQRKSRTAQKNQQGDIELHNLAISNELREYQCRRSSCASSCHGCPRTGCNTRSQTRRAAAAAQSSA
jgi:hypothetical protein